jgi:PAS domain S-box-containing protein
MQSKEGIDALFRHATEGILIVNELGEIIQINPSGEQLFGYGREELIGQKIEVLVPKRYAGRHSSYRDKYTSNPHARSMGGGVDLNGVKKDGTEFPLEISLSPYATPEGRFVIAFVVDISVRKQSEENLRNYSMELEKQVKNRTLILEEAIEELEKTKKELYNALEKERDLNELKSRFVSMASHEFRTPLTTIMSSLALVTKFGQMNDKDNQEKYIAKIKTSINNLTNILDDFLSVSRLEEGKVRNAPEDIDLRDFIGSIVAEMRTFATEGQQLIYEHTGSTFAVVDQKLLKAIMLNLISNAVKFSPDKKPITITSSIDKSTVRISVRDQGIGISKADQKHLFERFFRGKNATYIQGTGLGLNIISQYVELMQGKVEFESEENKGTVFTLTIPQIH